MRYSDYERVRPSRKSTGAEALGPVPVQGGELRPQAAPRAGPRGAGLEPLQQQPRRVVVGPLRDDGEIEVFRLGRENVLRLPDGEDS